MRVHVLAAASMAVAVLLAVAGSGELVWGAVDLDAVINMDVDFAQFRTAYSDRIEYEYGEESLLHQHLGGRQWVVEGTASEGQDVRNLEDVLNGRIVSYNDSVRISVSEVGYEFRLEPTSYGSAMERTVWITGNLTGYITNADLVLVPQPYARCYDYVPSGTLVLIRWLGPTIRDDIVIDGVPVNIPASLLREMEPEAYGLLAGTEADTILSRPLMYGVPIWAQPADEWLSEVYPADEWLSEVYPAGTSVEADTFGMSGGVMDVDVHTWTTNVDAPRVVTKEVDATAMTLNQTYAIRGTHDASSTTIRTIGTGVFDTVDGIEVVIDSPAATYCIPQADLDHADNMIFAFTAFTLVSIIALMLIVARRRDRRLQRNGDGRQAEAGAPP